MKSSKKLMIVLLVLAIVTALSAGTLAIYTSNIDTVTTTEITAKSFAFTKGETFNATAELSLAPGEANNSIAIYQLKNSDGAVVSEVPMDVAITPTFGDFFINYPDIQVTLTVKDGENEITHETWNAENTAENVAAINMDKVYEAGAARTLTCVLSAEWLQGHEDQNDRDMKTLDKGVQTMSLAFSATQDI